MPDGQMAFRASMRTRKSGRRHRGHGEDGGFAGADGAGGRNLGSVDEMEPTMDIQIPSVGRVQVPIDAPRAEAPNGVADGGTGANADHRRHGSVRRTRRLSAVATRRKSNFARHRSRSQSATPPLDHVPGRNEADFTQEQPKHRKSRFSTADVILPNIFSSL